MTYYTKNLVSVPVNGKFSWGIFEIDKGNLSEVTISLHTSKYSAENELMGISMHCDKAVPFVKGNNSYEGNTYKWVIKEVFEQ